MTNLVRRSVKLVYFDTMNSLKSALETFKKKKPYKFNIDLRLGPSVCLTSVSV